MTCLLHLKWEENLFWKLCKLERNKNGMCPFKKDTLTTNKINFTLIHFYSR